MILTTWAALILLIRTLDDIKKTGNIIFIIYCNYFYIFIRFIGQHYIIVARYLFDSETTYYMLHTSCVHVVHIKH